MPAVEPLLTIGQLAARAGVRPSRLRYYEEVGVLPPALRRDGQRRYGHEILRRLVAIDAAQRAGFSLDEIRVLTGDGGGGPGTDPDVRAVLDRRLAALDEEIARARAARRWLLDAQRCDCTGLLRCEIVRDAPPPGGYVTLGQTSRYQRRS